MRDIPIITESDGLGVEWYYRATGMNGISKHVVIYFQVCKGVRLDSSALAIKLYSLVEIDESGKAFTGNEAVRIQVPLALND